jgi:hypothetical protein
MQQLIFFTLLVLVTVPAFAGNLVQCGLNATCTGNSSNTQCTVTLGSKVTPHDSLMGVILMTGADNAITISSVSGDGAFTVGPHGSDASAGSATMAGLQNATGGETSLIVTVSPAPSTGWRWGVCEITPSVLEPTGNACTRDQGTSANPVASCSVMILASSRMENIFECISGSGTNATNLAGYYLAIASGAKACGYLSTTSSAAPNWSFQANTRAGIAGWSFSDPGGVTIR